MSIDLFLKIEGIAGESHNSNRKGWINIDSFTWGANQLGNMGGARKVQYRDLTQTPESVVSIPGIKSQYWEQTSFGGIGVESQSGWDI